MIKTVVSIDLPVDEKLLIKKNTISSAGNTEEADGLKRISIVTGIHGDELEGQFENQINVFIGFTTTLNI